MHPRRAFLSELFRALERQAIPYCVLRNYQELLDDNSSDVDLAVQSENLAALDSALAQAALASGYRLAHLARYINYSRVFWHSTAGFLRVDIDTAFRWRVFPVLATTALLGLRRKFGSFYIPHPRHESLILFLAATERGHLSERYRAQLSRLYEKVLPEELARTFTSAFGTVGKELAALQAADSRSVVPAGLFQRVRRSLVRRAFYDAPNRRALLDNLREDASRFWERVIHPPGLSLFVIGTSLLPDLSKFFERVEQLFPKAKLDFRETDCAGGGVGWGQKLGRLRTLFKGGLFVRACKVSDDIELSRLVREASRGSGSSRAVVFVRSSDGWTCLAQPGTGRMAECNTTTGAEIAAMLIEFICGATRPTTVSSKDRGADRSGQGKFVVFVGLDGAGKTTVARQLCAVANRDFRKIVYFHWRPKVFGSSVLPLREFKEIPRKPALGRSLVNSLLSAARLLKNLWLTSLAHWFRVVPLRERNSLILVDRYYYNYYLDPASVKYSGPGWLIDGMARLYPRPDLVVVFQAPPEVLRSRKQELSVDEIRRQSALLSALRFKAHAVLEIDATRPPPEIAGSILEALRAPPTAAG